MTHPPSWTCGRPPCRAGPWIEGNLAGQHGAGDRAAGTPFAAGVADRVQGVQRKALTIVLDPGDLGGIDEAAGDDDELACEEALVELPVVAVQRHGAVATDPPADAHREGGAQPILVEAVGRTLGGEVDRLWGAAHQGGV